MSRLNNLAATQADERLAAWFARRIPGYPRDVLTRIIARHRIAAEADSAKAIAELVEGLGRLTHDIDDLVDNSKGVTGLHLNGDIAPWSEIGEDGQYSPWLGQGMTHARALIAKHGGGDDA